MFEQSFSSLEKEKYVYSILLLMIGLKLFDGNSTSKNKTYELKNRSTRENINCPSVKMFWK